MTSPGRTYPIPGSNQTYKNEVLDHALGGKEKENEKKPNIGLNQNCMNMSTIMHDEKRKIWKEKREREGEENW